MEKAERVEETTLHLEKTLAINQFAVQVIWDSEFRIFLQCNSFGVILSVPVFQRNPKNLFLLVSYNIKSSGTGTRGVKAWGWPW